MVCYRTDRCSPLVCVPEISRPTTSRSVYLNFILILSCLRLLILNGVLVSLCMVLICIRLQGRDHLGGPRGRWNDNIKLYLKETEWNACTGLIWLRIRTSGGLLWPWWCTCSFHNIWWVSWQSEKLLAFEEGLYSMEYSTSPWPPEIKHDNGLIIRSISKGKCRRFSSCY